jgi:sortase A
MNQILVAQRIYVTKEMKRKQRVYKTIFILSLILILILLTYYVFAEKDRNDQEQISQEIKAKIASNDNTTVTEHAIVVALDEDTQNADQSENNVVEVQPVIEETETAEVTSKVTTSNGNTYETESVLDYPKLGISYPVLSEQSEQLLKISLNKYWGPKPNSIGNYCIVGHNYKNGKMFGKLSMATIGDEIDLTDLNNNTVTYTVYNKYVVEPTDVSCTSQLTNGKREITLITCTNYGKQRLVVKARES